MTKQSIKNLVAWMSHPSRFKFVNDAPNDFKKKRRIEKLKTEFESQSNFSSINFSNSGYVEDNGREDFLNDFANERAETALIEIKRHLIREDIQKTLVDRINAKNTIIRRNKEHKAKMQKQFSKNY